MAWGRLERRWSLFICRIKFIDRIVLVARRSRSGASEAVLWVGYPCDTELVAILPRAALSEYVLATER